MEKLNVNDAIEKMTEKQFNELQKIEKSGIYFDYTRKSILSWQHHGLAWSNIRLSKYNFITFREFKKRLINTVKSKPC